jgi:putative transposase
MRKNRFFESQIVAILNEHDAGVPMVELARKHGIHANTLRLWKAKYGGMDAAELARLKQLEDEKHECGGSSPTEGSSERAACRLAACPRRTFQYRIRRLDDPRIGERMRTIAAERPRSRLKSISHYRPCEYYAYSIRSGGGADFPKPCGSTTVRNSRVWRC